MRTACSTAGGSAPPTADPRRHPARRDPRRRPAGVRARRLPLRLHRRDRRPRARPGPRLPRRQDPADHARRRARARQPVPGLAGLVVRPPQRAGAGLRRRATSCGPRSSARTPSTSSTGSSRATTTAGRSSRAAAARPRATPTRRSSGRTDDASPSGLAYARRRTSGWPSLRGERLWRIDVDRTRRPASPTDYFVGEYGRMRTVVVAPDGTAVGDHQQPGRPRRPRGTDDDRILLVDPTARADVPTGALGTVGPTGGRPPRRR